MSLIKARDRHGNVAAVPEKWLERWPGDYTAVTEDAPTDPKPEGKTKKEATRG